MKKKTIILLAVAVVNYAWTMSENDSQVEMLIDVIKSYERPSSVMANVCWSSRYKRNLMDGLNKVHKSVIIIFQNENNTFQASRKTPVQNLIILIDIHCNNSIDILNKAHNMKNFRHPLRWIILGRPVESEIMPDELTTLDILPDSEVAVINAKGSGYIIHLGEKVKEANSKHNGARYVWGGRALGLHSAPMDTMSAPRVQDDFCLDSQIHTGVLVNDQYHGSITLFVYKIGPNTNWHAEFYGTWDVNNRFQKYENLGTSTAMRRSNLQRYVINISFVLTDPDSENHLHDRGNGQVDTLTKVNFHTTNNLLDFLNADKKCLFTSTWGYKINGSWNGMTGYLVREEIELGGTPLFITSERLSLIDYIACPTPTLSKFVFQQPNLSYENNLFLLSFRTAVWYSVIALLFLIFLVLFLVTYWEWKKNEDLGMRSKNAGILRPNITDIIILVLGAACQQGSAVELKGALGRVVMLVIFLTVMFLYTSYSANIVALLQSSSSQIQTLKDLLNSRIKCSVHDTVYNRYYFSTATEPVRQAIYQKKVAPPGVKPRFVSMEEGVKNIQKGLLAFHMETGVGYKYVAKYFLESQKCGLKEIQYLQSFDPWMAIRKNSPYKEIFKVGMRRIQEHGLQTRENLLLYEKQPKCTSRDANFVSVSILDCYPALLFLTYGIIVSLLILACEVLVHRKLTVMKKIGWPKETRLHFPDEFSN